jgi:signal transduction histidine kinase/DNA-binding response OmpR family regulator
LSVVPIVALSTALFIVIVHNLTEHQINGQINEKMDTSLETAALMIENELLGSSDIAHSLAKYMEVCDREAIENGEMKKYLMRMIPSHDNTMGGGVWFEPYAMYPDKLHFGPYVYVKDGEVFYEQDYAAAAGVDYHGTDWYRRGRLSDGPPLWSEAYYDPLAGTNMVTATAPFFGADGQMRGVATTDMSLDVIQGIARSISVGRTGRAFIVGAGGEYISFLDDSRDVSQNIQLDENEALASLGRAALATGSGMSEVEWDGSRHRAYYRTIATSSWILIILMGSGEIARLNWIQLLTVAVMPLLGLALVTASSVFTARHLRKVANKVNQFADLAASGDFSKRIAVSEVDEFGVMEVRLNKMMDHMSELYSQSVRMKDAAEAASRSKSDFLSNMSHEIRTPINAIMGMTAIGKSAGEIGRKDYAFEKIGDASTHLLGVINDILDMSKIEANKLELYSSEFNFEKMLQKVVSIINFRVDEKRQDFTVHIDSLVPRNLVGDDQRLSQVIVNLLTNAVKFTPEKGSIHLGASLLGEERGQCTLRIKVTDTGIGISEDQQALLFTSYQQADSSTSRNFGGTGLGLAISKRIVEMMGGNIWIESELGKGSTFAFTIQAARGAETPRQGIYARGAGRGGGGGDIRLMAVDDAPDILEYFQEIASGLRVSCDTARGAEEARRLIERNGAYDIYFVDWRMPGIDGVELARIIKSMGADASVVVMISAAELGGVEAEARAAGVDKFLPKPLFPSMIEDCINECLGGSAAPGGGEGGAGARGGESAGGAGKAGGENVGKAGGGGAGGAGGAGGESAGSAGKAGGGGEGAGEASGKAGGESARGGSGDGFGGGGSAAGRPEGSAANAASAESAKRAAGVESAASGGESAAEGEGASESAGGGGASGAAARAECGRILLVEDIEVNREIVKALLEPVSPLIDCAEDGEQALEIYGRSPDAYAIIFMDVQMPVMDGYEATRRIRALASPRARSVPIVAMTANVFREDIEKCLESGMDDHVSKPLDLGELHAVLGKYTGIRLGESSERG